MNVLTCFLALIFAACVGAGVRASSSEGEFPVRADGENDHVGFHGGISGLLLEDGIGEAVELPPRTLEVVVVDQLLREMFVELQGAGVRIVVFVGDDEVEGRRGYPASCTTPAAFSLLMRRKRSARFRSIS